MSSNSDEDLLFAERPDWVDVVPLEQYENLTPVAPIFYSTEYKDATNYFRAIVKSGEKSARVLELTENIIRQNPAHYTAWQYRYETLLNLISPSGTPLPSKHLATHPLLIAELTLMDVLAVQFLKTYQVWHHRRLLVALTRLPRRELDFIKKSLEVDAKNYHTWSYRQWLLAYFGGPGGGGVSTGTDEDDEDMEDTGADLWEGELDFVDGVLALDVRNNSAWHHRFFVVWGCGVRDGEKDRERVLKRELTYVKQNISLAPNNPSAWNYLRGILTHTATPLSSVAMFVKPYASIPPFTPSAAVTAAAGAAGSPVATKIAAPAATRDRDIVDLDNPPPGDGAELPCTEALEFLADVYEAQGNESGVEDAVEIWTNLANEYDTIRKKYWEHRIRDAHQALRKTQAA